MTGELIQSANTYNEGRVAINSAFSGEVSFNILSAETIYSGSTDLYDIFETGSGDITRVQGGTNLFTGGTANNPILNLIDSPSINNFTASGNTDLGILSADTIYSGSTELYNIFGTGSGTAITKSFQTLDCIGAGTSNWDFQNGYNAYIVLTGNTTLNITNSEDGDYGTLFIVQDGVGSKTLTLPGTDLVVNGGGGSITLSSTPNANDILSFVQYGIKRYWNVGLNYN